MIFNVRRTDRRYSYSAFLYEKLLTMEEGQTIALVSPFETLVFRLEKVEKREPKYEEHPEAPMWWYDEPGDLPFDRIKLVYGV